MEQFLGSLDISGFDVASYFKNQSTYAPNLPNIGLAFSGGGYRAMLTGGGALKAFDSRETTSGGLGGLLQSTTYIAGLSGGSWLVGSVYVNNFTTISNLQTGVGQLWNLTYAVFDGPDKSQTAQNDYYNLLASEVTGKQKAGFDISITDYWGRILSYQFINASNGGPDFTWSSIRDQPGFSTGNAPFPLVVADNRVHNQTGFPSGNTTIYEFNAYEMGSWDPTTYGFVDLAFLGSNFSNGQIPSDQECVRGYDNAGFVMGTSSSIFTPLAGALVSSEIPAGVQGELGGVVAETKEDDGFVAHFEPNPFKGWNPTGNSSDADTDTLFLVDGGTDGENLPLQPLLQTIRAVDVIIAVDSSNDVIGYPNGSALVLTSERLQSSIANSASFPEIPDTNTFVNQGLNQRPTFFGCNMESTPLVVYIPNAPYTILSNTSTFQLEYSYTQRDALITNGEFVATQGNGTANAEFRACLGCAILFRSFSRTQTDIPAACQTCYNAYCWNGTAASQTPSTPYSPNLIGASPSGLGLNVTGSVTSDSGNSTSGSSGSGPSGSGSGQGSSNENGTTPINSAPARLLRAGASLLAAVIAGMVLL